MRSLSKSLSIIFFVLFAFSLLLCVNTVSGETFIPPVPDKSKLLPANDGSPDGCDSTRFECVLDGEAVLDKQTGLIWARDTRFDNKSVPLQKAVKFCQNFELGNRKGWRLPTRDELITLLDTSNSSPAFPDGHPFKIRKGEGGAGYWTSTEYEGDSDYAWRIETNAGKVYESHKLMDAGIWPVHDSN